MSRTRSLIAANLALLLAGAAQPAAAYPGIMAIDIGTDGTPQKAEQPHGLTPQLLFALLAGEIALQRGETQMGLDYLLGALRDSGDPDLAERITRLALVSEQPAIAAEASQFWMDAEPNSLVALQLSAYALIDLEDYGSALEALSTLIDRAPDRALAYVQAAQLLARIADDTQRLGLLERLSEADGRSAESRFALALTHAALGDPQRARALADEAVQLRPDWDDPREFIVRALVTEERMPEAVAALDAFIDEHPSQALRLLRVQFAIQAEDYETALTQLDQMLAEQPESADLLFTAGALALEEEAFARATDYLMRLRETGERLDDAALLLGQVAESADDAEAALGWYQAVEGENAQKARIRAAFVQIREGQLEASRSLMDALRLKSPNEAAELYLIEAEMLHQHGHEQPAMALYDQAIDIWPEDTDLLYGRAMLAIGMDQVDLLERDLRQILIREPDHVNALNALGYTLADRTDRLDEALSLIQRAHQLSPETPAILDSLGWVLYRLGDPVAAEPYLRQALDAGFDAEIAAHLGKVLWALGQREQAEAIWDDALKAAPEHEYLNRLLGEHRFSHSEP